MADMLQFDLVSPERRLAAFDASMVEIPGMEGDFTAMPQHAPFLSTLRPGVVTAHTSQGAKAYFVTGGFAEISGDSASVLAESAVERDALTREYLDGQIKAAEAALADAPDHMKAAAAQRLNDYRAALSLVGG